MWALTLRNERQVYLFQKFCHETNSVVKALIGAEEISATGQHHWHAALQFQNKRKRSWCGYFGTELQNMWIRPLNPIHLETPRQAFLNFVRYACKEGNPEYVHNMDDREIPYVNMLSSQGLILPTPATPNPSPVVSEASVQLPSVPSHSPIRQFLSF